MVVTFDPPRESRSTGRVFFGLTPAAWSVLLGAVAVAAIARLPRLGIAAGRDEAGFLIVGGQWVHRGSSLYTDYWVDRPPLLLAIFGAADDHGGLATLRLVGCVAVAVTILASAITARLIAGSTAAQWTAVAATGLLISPMTDVVHVNGELLAAPAIAIGMACVVLALRGADTQLRSADAAGGRVTRRSLAWATAAGFMGAAAVLVKQNLVDVFVFAVVAVAVSVLKGRVGRRQALALLAAGVVGAAACTGLVAVLTVSRGTSLADVFYAMYPFRIKAGEVVAASGADYAAPRLSRLVWSGFMSGLVLVLVLAIVRLVFRRTFGRWLFALAAVMAFDVVSIVAGGSYWLHYLIQPIPAAAVTVGVLAANRGFAARTLATLVLLSGVFFWIVDPPAPGSSADTVGTALAASAAPGDTIVVTYGHADVVLASGLTSPYPYLWSLPVKTLDPDLTQLTALLDSSDRPTWIVTWPSVSSWGLESSHATAAFDSHYTYASTVCGRAIYLRSDVRRSALPTVADCTQPASISPASIGH